MNNNATNPAPRLPAAAETLLPHKGRMCCIDALTACADGGAEATAALYPGHALVGADGRMNAFGFIELAAQTAGAMHGFRAWPDRPDLAMLVGVQKFTAPGVAKTGDTLRISVATLGDLEGMLSLGFAVKADDSGDKPLAEGRLSVFVPRPDDARIAAMPRPAQPKEYAAARDIPKNVPDSIGSYAVDAPRIVAEEEGKKTLTAAFSFTPDFPGFDGHFPGNPIVPGIAQLMTAANAAAQGRPARVLGVSRCKFLRPVTPGERILVEATVETTDAALRCRAKLSVGGAPCAEAGFTLEPPPC